MTNGEKFKEIFSITQVDECDLNVYAWLPNHDAIEIPLEWWNTEYKEPKTGHWIPVSERKPEAFESVLVCYESQGGMAQAVSERLKTDTGYRWSALAGIEPIAWMPLPKPYEPQERSDKE